MELSHFALKQYPATTDIMQNDGDFPESATKVSETLATDKLAENEVKEEVCVVITDDIVSLKEGDIE